MSDIMFYVAECGEFPELGEYHRDIRSLEKAIKLYNEIPADRMKAGKVLGFELEDGSIYDGMPCELLSGKTILSEIVNYVQHFRESVSVQKAIADLQLAMEGGRI